MTQGINGAQATAANQVTSPVGKKDSDGDGGKSGQTTNIGPAVQLSLTNVAKNDMAQGDPDGDGH